MLRALTLYVYSAARRTWSGEPPGDTAPPEGGWRTALRTWRNRRQEQLELLYLLEDAPPHILNDVGLSRDQIRNEIDRLRSSRFW